MIKGMIRVMAAVTMTAVVSSAAMAAETKVVGKGFEITLDKHFNHFYVENLPIGNNKTLKTSFFLGNYQGIDLKIWIAAMDLGYLSVKERDAILDQVVVESFGAMKDAFKNQYQQLKIIDEKKNTFTIDGVPAREILFSATFNGQKMEGFASAAYKHNKIYYMNGVSTGLRSEFDLHGTDVMDNVSDTIKLNPDDPNFNNVSNKDFSMILPREMSIKSSVFEQGNVEGGIRTYEFTGASKDFDMNISVSAVDAVKLNDDQAIAKLMNGILNKAGSDFSDEMRVINSNVNVKFGPDQVEKFQGKYAVKKTFEFKVSTGQAKGEIMAIYAYPKAYVLISKTMAVNGMVADKPLSIMSDSLKTMRFN